MILQFGTTRKPTLWCRFVLWLNYRDVIVHYKLGSSFKGEKDAWETKLIGYKPEIMHAAIAFRAHMHRWIYWVGSTAEEKNTLNFCNSLW